MDIADVEATMEEMRAEERVTGYVDSLFLCLKVVMIDVENLCHFLERRLGR